MMTLKIDEENNAEAFWDAVADEIGSYREPLQALIRDGELACTQEEADDLLAHLKTLPGWSDEEAPSHAPHPVVVVE